MPPKSAQLRITTAKYESTNLPLSRRFSFNCITSHRDDVRILLWTFLFTLLSIKEEVFCRIKSEMLGTSGLNEELRR